MNGRRGGYLPRRPFMAEVGQAAVPDGAPDWGAPRAKTVQWYDPMIAAEAVAGSGLSGLEFLQALRDGKLPPAPIAALMGIDRPQRQLHAAGDQGERDPAGGGHGRQAGPQDSVLPRGDPRRRRQARRHATSSCLIIAGAEGG
jgi:hypothetical protein